MGVFQLMLIISLSAASRAHRCSDPWKEIEDDCWGFFAFKKGEPVTWNNAKLLCQRKGAVLGYPRTNTAFEDIVREANLSPEFVPGWRWMHVGLHSPTGINGTYVVLENGKEPNEEPPWTRRFPEGYSGRNGPCAQLNIGFVNDHHRPGLLVNFAWDYHDIRVGYACKDLEGKTTPAPPRPRTSTPGATRSQEGSTTGSVPRITDTTTTVAQIPYVLVLAVVGGLIGAIVTTGMCCGSAVLLHFFPDKDQADAASLDSKSEKETDDVSSGSDDIKIPVNDDDDD